MEEQPERGGGGGRARDLLAGDGVLHDLLESRARFSVVVRAQSRSSCYSSTRPGLGLHCVIRT